MDKQLDIRRPVPQKHHGLSTVCKVFFGVDIFQVVIVVVFQSSMIACGNFNAYNSPENPGMGPGRRIYMCVFMGVIVYTCFLCLFAVKQKNFLEILAFLIQNFGFVAYGLIQVYHVGYKKHPGRGSNVTMEHSPLLRKIALTNSLVLFLLNGVFIFLSWKLYIEFGWKIYKRVRFNLSLRSIYHFYQLLICLLKMAILYWWMYAICNSFVLLRDHKFAMYYINLSFIAMSVVYAYVGYVATQREIKTLMVFFILWTLGVIGYFIYKLYGFITDTCNGCQEFHETGKDIHDEALLHFVYLGTLNLLLLLAILGVASKVFSNFGKGLPQHFKPRTDKRPRSGTDLYLRSDSHYIEESVVSRTSNESEPDELNDSTRLGLGYQQVALTTGLVVLNSNARILASSMPNLCESTVKARTFPVSKEKDNAKDKIKASIVNDGIASATMCTLAVIDEDDDLMKGIAAHTPPSMQKNSKISKIYGQRKNERKELPENRINGRDTNGMNGHTAPGPIKESVRTRDRDLKNHNFNVIRADGQDDDDDDDDVFTDRIDERISRDSGFMESPQKPRENNETKAKIKTKKTPITFRDISLSSNTRSAADKRPPSPERRDFKLNQSSEIRKKISLFNGGAVVDS